MKRTDIDLTSLVPNGDMKYGMSGGVLEMTATRAIHDVGYNIRRDKLTSYMRLPGAYRLPVVIDLCVKIDSPEMLLLIGGGHISFASPWMENRRIEDIAEPSGKPKTYDNFMPLNEFVKISVTYELKSMRIAIDGEERYFSTRERYMKASGFAALNEKGFVFGVTCTKRAELSVKSITVTEYGSDAPAARNAINEIKKPAHDVTINEATNLQNAPLSPAPVKPTFGSVTADLPPDIKDEVIVTDGYLKSLSHLKFKRTIEKHGNKVTYVESSRGFSYAMYMSGGYMHHSFQWYIVAYGVPENWGRKANPLEAVLAEIVSASPGLAGRIYYDLCECVNCRENCLAKTVYSFREQKKTTCHGQVFLKMTRADFNDAREFIGLYNEIIKSE